MLYAQGLEKAFDGQPVLRQVDLQVKKGEVVAIIGPSGGGKSTLLRCLNHLELIDRGQIRIAGQVLVDTDAQGRARYVRDKEARRIMRHMGLVFQSFHLFPHFTVLRNLTEAQVHVLGREKKGAEATARELLEKVGLSDKADQYPFQLSGGQCQRVAIARALALNPQILCFDEPTSALDPRLTQEVLGVIRALAAEKRTMLVVTHEMGFAREVASRVVLMGEGRVVEQGPPDRVLGEGMSEAVRGFLGQG